MRQLLAICWPRDPQGSTQWVLRVTHTHTSHACSLEASQVNRVKLQTVTRSKHLGGQRGQAGPPRLPVLTVSGLCSRRPRPAARSPAVQTGQRGEGLRVPARPRGSAQAGVLGRGAPDRGPEAQRRQARSGKEPRITARPRSPGAEGAPQSPAPASEPCPRLQLRAVTGATPGTFPGACWLQP